MRWHHRLLRLYRPKVRARRYSRHAQTLGTDPEVPEQLELAKYLLRPLARRVFLMNRVDDMSYGEISYRVGLDVGAVERCIVDALISVRIVREEFR